MFLALLSVEAENTAQWLAIHARLDRQLVSLHVVGVARRVVFGVRPDGVEASVHEMPLGERNPTVGIRREIVDRFALGSDGVLIPRLALFTGGTLENEICGSPLDSEDPESRSIEIKLRIEETGLGSVGLGLNIENVEQLLPSDLELLLVIGGYSIELRRVALQGLNRGNRSFTLLPENTQGVLALQISGALQFFVFADLEVLAFLDSAIVTARKQVPARHDKCAYFVVFAADSIDVASHCCAPIEIDSRTRVAPGRPCAVLCRLESLGRGEVFVVVTQVHLFHCIWNPGNFREGKMPGSTTRQSFEAPVREPVGKLGGSKSIGSETESALHEGEIGATSAGTHSLLEHVAHALVVFDFQFRELDLATSPDHLEVNLGKVDHPLLDHGLLEMLLRKEGIT